MKIEEIRELAAIMSEHHLSGIEITEGDTHIKLRGAAAAVSSASSAAPVAAAAAVSPEGAAIASASSAPPPVPGSCLKSPMVGVFYTAPSPDAEPFVRVGSKVKKGDVVCIIEAMKLMNEITAERDGEITEILAEDGQVVEFSQPLFRVV